MEDAAKARYSQGIAHRTDKEIMEETPSPVVRSALIMAMTTATEIGTEMSQNSLRLSWPSEEVDERLKGIMKSIHTACVTTADEYGDPGNYVLGANIAGFTKVADTMIDLGLV